MSVVILVVGMGRSLARGERLLEQGTVAAGWVKEKVRG